MSGYYGWYRPEPPKCVKGGIKSSSQRGSFASKWWGKRWLQTLESFNIGARLARGRSYARKGQVTALEITPGQVRAQVQGTRARPYRVQISIKTFTLQQWQRVVQELVEHPLYAAHLLGNEMPLDIEAVFDNVGVQIFPKKRDLESDCSCPDWSNPCKHIAAVYYLMAEAFDRDPFMLFVLRGMEREAFLKALRTSSDEAGLSPDDMVAIEPEPLPQKAEVFWHHQPLSVPDNPAPRAGKNHAGLPRRLGMISFWRSDENFLAVMEKDYEHAQQQALYYYEKLKCDRD